MEAQEIQRYSRQLILKGWGEKEQDLLSSLTVVIPENLPLAALYLAAAGVGRICIQGSLPPLLAEHLAAFNPGCAICSEQHICKGNISIFSLHEASTKFPISIIDRPTSQSEQLRIEVKFKAGDEDLAGALAACTLLGAISNSTLNSY